MDGQPVVAHRERKRGFRVSRHASVLQAKAFQLLCAEHRPEEPIDSSEQTPRDRSPQLALQEVR